jgi:hypothetical protein
LDIRRRFRRREHKESDVQWGPPSKITCPPSAEGLSLLTTGIGQADEHDVVVVSLNYRLNIFGFPRAPFLPDQNLGLLDQRMATVWVRDK